MTGTILMDGLNVDDVASDEPREVFDPGEHTIADIDEYVDSLSDADRANELARLHFVETQRGDDARSTLLSSLENRQAVEQARLEEEYGIDPSGKSIPEVQEYVERHRGDGLVERLTQLREREADGKARKTLLTWLDNEITFATDLVQDGSASAADSAVPEAGEDQDAPVSDPYDPTQKDEAQLGPYPGEEQPVSAALPQPGVQDVGEREVDQAATVPDDAQNVAGQSVPEPSNEPAGDGAEVDTTSEES